MTARLPVGAQLMGKVTPMPQGSPEQSGGHEYQFLIRDDCILQPLRRTSEVAPSARVEHARWLEVTTSPRPQVACPSPSASRSGPLPTDPFTTQVLLMKTSLRPAMHGRTRSAAAVFPPVSRTFNVESPAIRPYGQAKRPPSRRRSMGNGAIHGRGLGLPSSTCSPVPWGNWRRVTP